MISKCEDQTCPERLELEPVREIGRLRQELTRVTIQRDAAIIEAESAKGSELHVSVVRLNAAQLDAKSRENSNLSMVRKLGQPRLELSRALRRRDEVEARLAGEVAISTALRRERDALRQHVRLCDWAVPS